MSKNVTIQDIADALGLSRNTVSKALNGRHVPTKTRNAVITAAIEMGYKGYKLVASSDGMPLGQKRFIILSTRLLMSINYHIYVLRGIEESLSDYDVDLMQFAITSPNSFVKFKHYLENNKVDGIIAMEFFEADYISQLTELGIPMVFLDFPFPEKPIRGHFDVILPESRDAVRGLCTKLIEEDNCKTFGFVGDFQHCRTFFDRYCGMLEAQFLHSNPVSTPYSIVHRDSLSYSPAVLMQAVQKLPALPDCFVAANDFIALNLITALRSLKIAVPKTVRVIGFDNGPEGKTSIPPLTTFNVNKYAMGQQIVSVLLDRINTPNRANNTIYVTSRPVVRSTT